MNQTNEIKRWRFLS
ncbi:Putative uncharacterized protein [Lacticaseibacillus paracasei]|nr:Putative uncharacterized protein [Lacticaseibacillus paracasei]